MLIYRPIVLVAAFAVAATITSCAYLTPKQDLGPELEELQGLRASLTTEWQAVDTLLDGVENDVAGFSTEPIDKVAADTPEISDLIVDAIDTGTAKGDPVGAWTDACAKVETAIDGADAGARSAVDDFMTRGASIYSALEVGLPTAIEQTLSAAGAAALAAAQIKLTGEQKVAIARQNPLMTAADVRVLETDYATVEHEVSELQAFAQQITAESAGQGSRVAAALARFESQLRSLDDRD